MKLLSILIFGASLATLGRAAEEADPSIKLREQLRAVTLQLRTAQTETASAVAAAAAADQKVAGLETKVTELGKTNAGLIQQAAADKQAAETARLALERRIVERDHSLEQHKLALEKWKEGYEKAAAAAAATEEQRVALAAQLAGTRNTLADRERKNVALFNTALEILDRYEKYALGKAIAAKEPFIGTTRVKIENLVQDYKDRILDSRAAAKSRGKSD